MSRLWLKALRLLVCGALLSLVCAGFGAFADVTVEHDAKPPGQPDSHIVVAPAGMDRNGNRVDDRLEATYHRWRRAGAQAKGAPPAADLLICLDHAPTAADLERYRAIGAIKEEAWHDLIYALRARLPASKLPPEALDRLGQDPGVVWVEENPVGHFDAYFATRQTRARAAWQAGFEGSPNQSVAIIDSGMDGTHPDLASRIAAWIDFAGADLLADGDEYPTPVDHIQHGTSVAGLAAGDGSAAGISTGVSGLSLTFPAVMNVLAQTAGYFPVDTTAATGPSSLIARLKWRVAFPSAVHSVQLLGDLNAGAPLLANGSTPAGERQPFTLSADNLTPGISSFVFGARLTTSSDIPTTAPFFLLPAWLQISTPMSAVGDGKPLMRGVAPGCKIVGVKVGDDRGGLLGSAAINGVSWINANKRVYNIVAVNASWNFPGPSAVIEALVNQLVRNGVVWVNSAGNSRPTAGISAPALAAKAITVGAMSDEDRVTSYSSFGRPGQRKPDLLAPSSSSFTRRSLIAPDSNTVDIDLLSGANVPDQYPNDYVTFGGTSGAAPQVAGAVMLMAQAMGDWSYTEAQALRVKMLLLMTASETGRPAERDPNPTLDRGGKDVSEGFGRMNIDAAVEAVAQSLPLGSSQTATLGPGPFDKRVWARSVSLAGGTTYSFVLVNPANADDDLYLYSDTPVSVENSDGEPQIVASSTQAVLGGAELVQFTPAASARYYLVVKHVGGGGGAFQLNSAASSDFALSVSPGAQVLETKGESVSFTVSVKGLAGFSDTVNLALAGTLPAGVTAQFQPASVSPGGASTLTLTTSGATPSGGHLFSIQGSTSDRAHTAPARLEVGAIWPRFHHDGRSSGRTAFNGPQTARQAWVSSVGAEIFSSPAIGGDGTVYVGARNSRIRAVRASDGAVLWIYVLSGNANVDSSPAVGIDGTLYFGADDGQFYALRPDGTLKWNFSLGATAVRSGPVIAPDGTIYVTAGGTLHAMRPDGTRKWTFDGSGTDASSPVLAPDGTIYFGAGNRLYAIRDTGAAGEQKWELETTGSVLSTPAVANGRIYFGSNGDDSGGRLYVVSDGGSSATKVAETTTGGAVQSSPAVGPSGDVYVGCEDNNLYAFDANGALKWRAATGAEVRSSPAVGADGMIYVGSRDKRIYAVRDQGSSATQVWRFDTGGEIQASPAIGADGTLYVPSFDGRLYAFQDNAPPNFSTSIPPVRLAALVGGSGTYTVSLQALNSFSGPVTFQVAETLPKGVNAAFEPATVTLSSGDAGRTTLRLSTTSDAPAGEFPFHVRATSGSIVRETGPASLYLVDYSLLGQPAAKQITAGQSAQFSVTALSNPYFERFTAPILLTASVVANPAGATLPALGLDRSSVTPPGLVTLTAATTNATTPGSYVVEVKGTSGAATRTTRFRLDVAAGP